MEQIVNQSTHQHSIYLTCFFLNYPCTKYTIDILPGFADDDILCVDIEMRSEISKQNPREIYLHHRANWDSIKEDLIFLLNSFDFSSTDTKTVELWTKFKATILHSMRLHIPYKLTRTRCDLQWLTSDIRKKIRKRNKLYLQYKRSHLPEVRSRFLQLKSDIQRQMRQSNDAYISRLITDSEGETSSINPKRFWSFIKKLRKDSNGTQSLKVDSNVITDSKEKASILRISQMKSYLTKVLAHIHKWKISMQQLLAY